MTIPSSSATISSQAISTEQIAVRSKPAPKVAPEPEKERDTATTIGETTTGPAANPDASGSTGTRLNAIA